MRIQFRPRKTGLQTSCLARILKRRLLRARSLCRLKKLFSAQTPDHKTEVPTAEQSKPPPTPSQSNHKLTIPTRLTHALPPKPVTASIPYVPPSDPTIVEATAMASRPKKVDTSGHELKDGSRYDHIGPLPPQWEIRFSRDRPNEFYYYDLRYKVSTWDRPVSLLATLYRVYRT